MTDKAEIKLAKGSVVVDAFIVGNFAVHKTIGSHIGSEALTCTHLPTGLGIQSVGHGKKGGRKYMEDLARRWAAIDGTDSDDKAEINRLLEPVYREWADLP